MIKKLGLNKLMENGFFHIFGSNVLNKIIQFCAGIFIVRVLNKNEFGIYTYSQNLIAFFLLMNGFGIMNGLLQYGTKKINSEEKNELLKYSVKVSVVSNLLIVLAIVVYSKFGNFKIDGAKNVFLFMCLYPISSIFVELIQIKNRIDLENKKMALNTNINTFFNLFFMIILGKIFGIYGVVLGKYFANMITIIYGHKSVKETFVLWKEIKELSEDKKKGMFKFSFVSMLNNGISQLLYIIDIFIIGILIGNSDVIAGYKTATLIPFALNFIPMSIMTYMYPYFSRNSENPEYLSKKYRDLLKYGLLLNGFITLFLLVFSKYIITIVFGENYIEAVKPFQILSIGYFFAATFRIPAGNLLAAIGAIKFNFYTTIICGILNIVLDIYLIKTYGSIGAAIATTMIFVISSIIGNYFLYNKILKKGKITNE